MAKNKLETIKQPEAESGLSKQLLGNFQTENSCNQKYCACIARALE